jgi:AcrR family transcriptional regulator
MFAEWPKVPRYSEKQKAALDALMRDDVYRHALEILETEGVSGLTVDGIAKAVGVSRGTLYNYFADRDAIIDFVEERTFSPLLDEIDRIADGETNPADKMQAIATAVFSGVHENFALVMALSPEKSRRYGRECKQEGHRRGQAAIQRVIAAGMSEGVFRRLPLELTADVFFSSVAGMIDHMARQGELRRPEEIVPTFMNILLRGLNR